MPAGLPAPRLLADGGYAHAAVHRVCLARSPGNRSACSTKAAAQAPIKIGFLAPLSRGHRPGGQGHVQRL